MTGQRLPFPRCPNQIGSLGPYLDHQNCPSLSPHVRELATEFVLGGQDQTPLVLWIEHSPFHSWLAASFAWASAMAPFSAWTWWPSASPTARVTARVTAGSTLPAAECG